MSVTLSMLLTVCPLAFLAAIVDAIGGGGGLISLPAYLLTGLPPALASGSNKMSACLGTMVATGKFLRGGKLLVKPSLCAIAGALPGAYLGAELLQMCDPNIIRILLVVVIPLMALILLFKKDAPEKSAPMTAGRLWGCAGIGLVCGLYDGFFGPGTGTLLIMGLTYLIGMDMITASGCAKLINLASNISALVSLISGGEVLFALALPAAAFSIAGGYLGSYLAMRRGAKLIRYIMLGVLVLLIIRLIVQWFA